MSAKKLVALDLFAGTGWAVACRALGIEEHGVEIMPEAVATREANGMSTIYRDVWEGLSGAHDVPVHDLLIASPPCQTFSMAGKGAGRQALDDVLGLIRDGAYLDVEKLRAFGEKHDPRTALVLTPLAHVARDTPLHVVFEQVPPVLPVWEACADVMRSWGYSVWTGIVNAEQYGVPQTRRRAILIARADGVEAAMPEPTHSRYYSRDPEKMDPGVLPWVSMAEALGWGMTERPMVTAGNAIGRAEGVGGSGAKAAIQREKSRGAWLGWGMTKRPYPTISTGAATAGGGTDPMALGGSGGRAILAREKARGDWIEPVDMPATTVAGDPRVWPRGHKINADDVARLGEDEARERYGDRAGTGAARVSIAEAAALQSYPPDFEWNVTMPDGKPMTKTKTFLQIGNAVPPLLAEAIIVAAIGRNDR